MKSLWLSALLLAATLAPAADIVSIPLVLPASFEANQGQLDLPATHLAPNQGWAFDCSTLYGRLLYFTTTVPRLALAHPSSSCQAELTTTLDTQAYYYRGSHRGDWLESVPRFQALSFRGVASGLTWRYQSNGDAIAWRWEFDAGVDPASAPLTNDRELLARLPVPTATQAGRALPVHWQSNSQTDEVALVVENRDPALPLAVTIALPNLTSTFASISSRDSAGNWLLLTATDALSAFDSRTSTCVLDQWYSACPGISAARFSTDGKLISQTLLSGARYQIPTAVRFDPDNHIYLAGTTYSEDFPITEDAAQPHYAGPAEMQLNRRHYPGGDAFLVKLYRDNGALIRSTFAGTASSDSPVDLAVDQAGRPSLVYSSRPDQDTVTYQLIRLNESFTQIERTQPLDSFSAMSLAPEGSLYLLRNENTIDRIPPFDEPLETLTLPDGYTATSLSAAPGSVLWLSSFRTPSTPGLARLTPNAFAFFPGWPSGTIQAGRDGSLGYLTYANNSASRSLPTTPATAILPTPCLTSPYYALFTPELTPAYATFLPALGNCSLDWNGLPMCGDGANAAALHLDASPKPRLACVEPNALELLPASRLAPAMLVSLRGRQIGPDLPQDWQLDENGRISTSLAGTTVTVAGLPAPILHAGPHTIDVILPYDTPTNQSITLEITRDSIPIAAQTLSAVRHDLLITKIVNEDGSENSAAHPAPLGSTLRFLGSGAGPTDPPGVDGQINHPTLAVPLWSMSFAYDGATIPPLRFQQASDQPAGVMEALFSLPSTPPSTHTRAPGSASIRVVTDASSHGLTIYYK